MGDICRYASGFQRDGDAYECVRPVGAKLLSLTALNKSNSPNFSPPRALWQTRRRRKDYNENSGPHWLVQFADLDLSWGHRLLGCSDGVCLLAGLLYGVLIVVCSAFAWDVGALGCRPRLPCWFLSFARLQLVVYICQIVVKYQNLCDLQRKYFPAFETTCGSLRFAF